jgi:O-antigen/teichoic acid export membrane protein
LIDYIKNKLKTNENNKVIFYNTLGAFLVKGSALFVSLFTMPAYMRYFNNEQVLGLWFTALSVLSWILIFDLGIGNGLRNHLVPALIEKDEEKIKKYISSAYVIIGTVAFISMVGSTVLFRFINWNFIFNISEDLIAKDVLNTTVLIVFMGIMLQFLLKLISSILYAMQRSAIINSLSLISSILILLYVTFSSTTDLSKNLISLAIIYVLAYNLPLLVTSLIIFSKSLKSCKPEVKYFDKEYASNIVKLGGAFFWVQIMYMVIVTTNEFLISLLTDPSMVVEYQVYNKLFTLIGTVFMLALTPIWSAVTKAVAEKKYSWINKLYKILKWMTLVAVICQFGMIVFLQFGINLWLGDRAIAVNYLYASVFALFGSIFIWNGVLSSIANGFGELKTQSIYFTIGAIIKIPVAWILVSIFNSWIGVVMANIVSMSLYCIMQPIWLDKFLSAKRIGDE